MRFVVDVIMTALALWLVTLVVPGVEVMGGVGAFIWVALVFMFVNAFISPVVNLISLPLKILTLGLFSLLVNTLLFSIVGWISDGLGNGLQIDGFWAAFFGAIVMAIASWIVEGVFKATGLSGDKTKA
ncbi:MULTISPECIES: phage holin family protein [unclassified Corynebacterium]|uniref:phage holin family protein n=1 Tax=unclassified Corynebacterium TaxID=2624378 RepID=UPI00264F19CB|nr:MULTISPECIES: phage holin family protein [unclassified Corynebacterium]MDN8594366.1 phage holin family protein [Corynebacterium sp. P4_F2]WKK55093.1 phage holin family protein [Corynebacterium sp. P4-C1]WKK62507.1 phage holin family protein [Corynebacterium sp. P8-C1]